MNNRKNSDGFEGQDRDSVVVRAYPLAFVIGILGLFLLMFLVRSAQGGVG